MRKIRLCLYAYDPLDRLVRTSPVIDAESQRFYCKGRLATEIQGQLKKSIFQYNEQPLAEQLDGGITMGIRLLATDKQQSILHSVGANLTQPIAYSPYGCRYGSGWLSLLGFNGERQDPVTGRYFLGNGYRGFNPILMRFDTPDSWSPFGKGGLNPYVYCLGDPVNRRDPSGHFSFWDDLIRFAGRAHTGRGTASRMVGSSIPVRPTMPNPGATMAAPSATILEPITTPFTYRPIGANIRPHNTSGLTGSLDSLTSSHSTGSLRSPSSSLESLQSFGSISSRSSTSSTESAFSSSRRGSFSTISVWSGSGRRNDLTWGSNESLNSVSTYSSGTSPRVTIEDSVLTFDSQGNVSYLPDPVSDQTSRIRR
ncbi:RHS repeat-associated core domain-containing protein [Pseudomonas sp. C2B4]|nr:RHS repeat-associated core domain-containing protein [Pseudomonas sp. C2B4]